MKKNVYYNPSAKDLTAQWYLLDAKGQTLGKVAVRAAMILMGKHEASYVPHLDNGHRLVIINVAHLALDQKKLEGKIYWRHTGFPGGIRRRTLGDLMERQPTEVVLNAIRGMLPKTRSGRAMLDKLHIYAEDQHDQIAQQPTVITI